jgi:predicted dehydrogenase
VALSELRVAVVGCGLIGRRRALVAAQSPLSATVAVADSVPNVAATLARELNCKSVPGWREAVADRDVDVVIVATPNAFLAEIAVAALDAGKHVLLEKPMGGNLTEARAISAAAQRAGRLVKVGFNHRYNPAIARAHAEFAAGSTRTLRGAVN